MAAWKNVGSGPWRRWAGLYLVRGPHGWSGGCNPCCTGSAQLKQRLPLLTTALLTRLTGLVLESSGLRAPVGAQCHCKCQGRAGVLAEVVGFARRRAF